MPMAADIVPIVLRVPRRDVAYVKFVFESYEGVAVTRTLSVEPTSAVVVVYAVPAAPLIDAQLAPDESQRRHW